MVHSALTFYKITSYVIDGNCENLRLIWQGDWNLNIDKGSWKKKIPRAVYKKSLGKNLHTLS